jgi:hypothetical protein
MEGHQEHKPEKRIDLNSELGMSRRDLLRRSAIVGGTLLWVAPAIQSMAPKAFAQEAGGSVTCSACYCWTGSKSNPTFETGTFGFTTAQECATFCTDRRPGSSSEFCQGTDCDLQIGVVGGAQHGAFCS